MTAKELIEKLSEVVDRKVIWSLLRVMRMHCTKEWKKEQIYNLLQEFSKNA